MSEYDVGGSCNPLFLPDGLHVWEAAAIVPSVIKGSIIISRCISGTEGHDLLYFTGVPRSSYPGTKLATADAYRRVDTGNTPYAAVLAQQTGIPEELGPAVFPGIKASTDGPIVLCPHPPKTDMELPAQAWRTILRHLRSYGLPIRFLGDRGQRLDTCAVTESEIASEYSIQDKLALLASASLVVGVPCAWTWLATAWDKKMVVYYPLNLPLERWFHFDSPTDSYRVITYEDHALKIPMLLLGLRMAVAQL